ncbi:MAG: neutral/alkaline non-lysosomal ceramidase N-terminal domain-containing protein [Polyangiaceae bacterium]
MGEGSRLAARIGRVALAFTTHAFATSCLLAKGPIQSVDQPVPTSQDEPADLQGGAWEVDITPPPGLPTYGYSSNGSGDARGYWLRLKARIIVLARGSTSLAMVQADLGAASSLVHRRVAALLAPDGFDPPHVLIATTHTHGGPGGFFGDKFLNQAVGAVPAFIPEYVDFLATRIADGIRTARSQRKKAAIAYGQIQVPASATFNRSIEAWRRNFTDQGLRFDDVNAVDRTLTLLRVDLDGKPAASWSAFAVHGTAMPAGYPLFHGDVHGLSARLLAERIGAPGFVAATATGAEGDVSPGALGRAQGKELLLDAATAQAEAAYTLFNRLEPDLRRDVELRVAYSERSLRGAGTSLGRLCEGAVLGGAEAAGSEASRGPLYGFLEMSEGAIRSRGMGCSGTKIKIFGAIQDLVFDADEFPDIVAFQTIALLPDTGPPLVLASVPGEPTTETGRRIIAEVKARMQSLGSADDGNRWLDAIVAPLGLTNSYSLYLTMPGEYSAQHYEGGTTPYGPYQGLFVAEELGRLAYSMVCNDAQTPCGPAFPTLEYVAHREFQPGASKGIWPEQSTCRFGDWSAAALGCERRAGETDQSDPTHVTFRWRGMTDNEMCGLATVSIECPTSGARPSAQPGDVMATDEGRDFEVALDGPDEWTATWDRRGRTNEHDCYVVVRHLGLERPIVSDALDLKRSP